MRRLADAVELNDTSVDEPLLLESGGSVDGQGGASVTPRKAWSDVHVAPPAPEEIDSVIAVKHPEVQPLMAVLSGQVRCGPIMAMLGVGLCSWHVLP